MKKFLLALIAVLAICQGQGQMSETMPHFKVVTEANNAPFNSLDNTHTAVGFDVDFLQALAIRVSFTYDLAQLLWTDIFDQINNDQADFAIAAITITDERRQNYTFSAPYFSDRSKILAPEDTDIVTAQDLTQKIVGVRKESTAAEAVIRIFGGDNANIKTYDNQDEVIQALINGDIDAYIDDGETLEFFAQSNGGFVVIDDPEAFETEFYALMFSKDNALVSVMNDAIRAILEDGEYTSIYSRWFNGTPDVALLLEAGDEEMGENEEGEYSTSEEGDLAWDEEDLGNLGLLL